MVAAAVVGGAVLSAGIGAAASSSAANKQVGAANNATALQQSIYNQNEANLSPYMQQGNAASSKLSDLLGTSGNTGASGYGSLNSSFTAQDYLNNQDPGYAFQLNQGQQALQNSQAAGNGVLSGSSLKDLISYNQGVASTGYQNAFDRWQTQNTNVYNRLLGTSQLGENAAAGAGNTGATIGANEANTITGAGNAAASGTVGTANALTSGVNNATGYYALNSMLNGSSGTATTLPVGSVSNDAAYMNLG